MMQRGGHRFTPVRDGWTRNEVWDLGVSTCTWLSFIALWMYCWIMGVSVCVCVCLCGSV